jgi:hypothetical protein
MGKNSAAGERIAYAKRALEAAEFVDEAASWAHRLILGECHKAGEYLDAMRRGLGRTWRRALQMRETSWPPFTNLSDLKAGSLHDRKRPAVDQSR